MAKQKERFSAGFTTCLNKGTDSTEARRGGLSAHRGFYAAQGGLWIAWGGRGRSTCGINPKAAMKNKQRVLSLIGEQRGRSRLMKMILSPKEDRKAVKKFPEWMRPQTTHRKVAN